MRPEQKGCDVSFDCTGYPSILIDGKRLAGKHSMYCLLHIGKTGGTYTRHVISSVPAATALVRFLDHSFTLEAALKTFPDETALFAVRHPFEIFVSGFNSRLRKGQPRYNFPWSPDEAVAFAAFQTPNRLAEGLSAVDSKFRRLAEFSMHSIPHASRCLHFFLNSVPALRQYRSRIFFILRQACLDDDIERYFSKIGIQYCHNPIHDDAIRHRNPVDMYRALSPTAMRNLKAWYKTDLEIYSECIALRSEIIA